MTSWKKDWEYALRGKLLQKMIPFERTSIKLSSSLTKLRDDEWDKKIQGGQIVELVYPARNGGKIKVKGRDINDLPILLGTVEFYKDEVDYKIGIICQLLEKDLHYANGDKRNCLEFEQAIFLIDAGEVPHSMMENKTLKLREKPTEVSVGCLGGVMYMVIISIIIVYGFIWLFSC